MVNGLKEDVPNYANYKLRENTENVHHIFLAVLYSSFSLLLFRLDPIEQICQVVQRRVFCCCGLWPKTVSIIVKDRIINPSGHELTDNPKKINSGYGRVGQTFFSKERNVLAFFCILYKITRRSLGSFTSL